MSRPPRCSASSCPSPTSSCGATSNCCLHGRLWTSGNCASPWRTGETRETSSSSSRPRSWTPTTAAARAKPSASASSPGSATGPCRRRFRRKYLACPGGALKLANALKDAGLAASATAAYRLIEQGAVRVDGERVGSRDAVLEAGSTYLLQAGKRGIARVTVRDPEPVQKPLTPSNGGLYCAPPTSGGPERTARAGLCGMLLCCTGPLNAGHNTRLTPDAFAGREFFKNLQVICVGTRVRLSSNGRHCE